MLWRKKEKTASRNIDLPFSRATRAATARPRLFLYSFPEFDYPVRYDSLPAPQANDNTLQEHP